MTQLRVENFGPIKSFAGDITGFNILIGPQASGKSTIARILYFFKMIPFWIGEYESTNEQANHYGEFVKTIRHKFLNLFGPVLHHRNMRISYSYNPANPSCVIEIFNRDNLVRFRFQDATKSMINDLLSTMTRDRKQTMDESKSFSGLVRMKKERELFSPKYYTDKAKEMLCMSQTPIFIPAGRTLLTLLSGQVSKIPHDERDFIMKDFLDTISNIRPQFQFSLEELATKAMATQAVQPDRDRAALARDMIYTILRGRYVVSGGEERIYHSDTEYTKLSYASSGQQESVWILLVAYMLILEREDVFVVFEEPEAHLFPEGQDAVVRLLSLLHGASQNNQVVITTHSPYVLTSVNNLIHAGSVGKKNSERVSQIVNKKFWLSFSNVSAYSIRGTGDDIMDADLGMIKAEEIDTASHLLNIEYDRVSEI